MPADREQNILLNAIAFLQAQYRFLGDPCLALTISRQYCLLARSNSDIAVRKSYQDRARTWLWLYMQRRKLSPELRSRLADLALLEEYN